MVEGRSSEATQGREGATGEMTGEVSERTCVGCSKKIDRRDEGAPVVRIVLGPEAEAGEAREIAIDPGARGGGRLDGRGAHVHLTPACVRGAAEKGLQRSFRSALRLGDDKLSPASLATAIIAAEDRTLGGIVAAAVRSKKAVVGTEAARTALRAEQARCVIVATDARAAADLSEVRRAVSEGLAVAWGTKASLRQAISGSGRHGADPGADDGVAVLTIVDRELAAGFQNVLRAADSLRSLVASSMSSRRVNGPSPDDGAKCTFSDKQAVE